MSLVANVLDKESTITVLNPQDGSLVGEVYNANEADALHAVDIAVDAAEIV